MAAPPMSRLPSTGLRSIAVTKRARRFSSRELMLFSIKLSAPERSQAPLFYYRQQCAPPQECRATRIIHALYTPRAHAIAGDSILRGDPSRLAPPPRTTSPLDRFQGRLFLVAFVSEAVLP